MGFYFEDHDSMHAHAGFQVEQTLASVVRRYLGHNPPHPPTFRAYDPSGIARGKDYRYVADFNRFFPDAAGGQFVYAWAKYWSANPGELKFDVDCHSPTIVYLNGAEVFRSTIFEERNSDSRNAVALPVRPGWNHVVIRFKKTRGGFGGVFGTWLGKLPYYFLVPHPDREGQEGWLFTEPLSEPLASIPGTGTLPGETGVQWFPRQQWSDALLAKGQFARIYGSARRACAVGWTQAFFHQPGLGDYVLSGRARSRMTVFIDDRPVFSAGGPGEVSASISVAFGLRDVMVVGESGPDDWGFDLQVQCREAPLPLHSPCRLTGSTQPWIFAGPFAAGQTPPLATLRDFHTLPKGLDGDTYWRIDLPDTWVRIYNENALYGRWNYPLGVTLYGLLHAARAVGSDEAVQYVVNHIQYCCDLFPYAQWDRRQYGGATNVHHLLTSIDSLDDCGSFGSVLLEVARHCEVHGYREIADFVADYIARKQIRLPDGTFFRKNLMHTFHEDTLWADDLYMSVPFLCRYYQLTGQRSFIDDAARQFLGFKRHLFMPELKVMSHVYDFRRRLATGVPWGRGNGWVVFSLSELLAVLPEDHELRPELLGMFRELCEGMLVLQDSQGMWHQVLNEHDSYPETSCTSMIAYAYARGVQYGWLEAPDPYVRAVFTAWEALNRVSIDKLGNIHGVCRGSEFSFTSDYYKNELLWNLNDTHGIGIVLLVGVEVRRLMKHLAAPGGAEDGGNGLPAADAEGETVAEVARPPAG